MVEFALRKIDRIEASCVTGCGFDHHSRKYLFKLIFSFVRYGVEGGVELRHSTRNSSIIRRKVGNVS